MKLFVYLKWLVSKVSQPSEEPLEDCKRLVGNIQRVIGVNDVFGDSNHGWTLYSIMATILFTGAFVYLGIISQMMFLLEVIPDPVTSFQAINCLSSTSVPFSKYLFMLTSRNRLKRLFQMNNQILSSLHGHFQARAEMVKSLQRSRYISLLVIINIASTHSIYLIAPSLLSIFGNQRYLPTTPTTAYGLNPRYESPYYEANFIITILGTVFSAVNQTGYIVLFLTLIATEIGQITAITENLNQIRGILFDSNLKKADRNRQVEEKLRFCIQQHQFLLKYHDEVKLLYRFIFGAHFLIMTVDIVSTLVTINTWELTSTFLTGLTGIIPLFLYCFGGESLLSAGLSNSSALYACGWEVMDKKHAIMIQFMMRASQKPLILKAAGTFVMNRETFGNIVQIIYRICAVLQPDSN